MWSRCSPVSRQRQNLENGFSQRFLAAVAGQPLHGRVPEGAAALRVERQDAVEARFQQALGQGQRVFSGSGTASGSLPAGCHTSSPLDRFRAREPEQSAYVRHALDLCASYHGRDL